MKTMNTMKTMKLTGLHQMELREAPRPEIVQDTDVLIQMAQVGICGSDVHYYAEGGIGSQRVAYPWTVGHEGAGIVAEVGPAVTRVQIGDRVALDPAQPCGVCDQCRSGRPHTCRALNFLGCPGQVEGCLAEYTRMPESSCYPIPDKPPWSSHCPSPSTPPAWQRPCRDTHRARPWGFWGPDPSA
jgi:L-iditol 2-dehydrogenase